MIATGRENDAPRMAYQVREVGQGADESACHVAETLFDARRWICKRYPSFFYGGPMHDVLFNHMSDEGVLGPVDARGVGVEITRVEAVAGGSRPPVQGH